MTNTNFETRVPGYFTTTEVAGVLGVTPATLYNAGLARTLTSYKTGEGRTAPRLYVASEVLDLVEIRAQYESLSDALTAWKVRQVKALPDENGEALQGVE